jgi:hypothetical protein
MELKLTVDNLGQALIHVKRAKWHSEKAYNRVKNCRLCSEQEKQSLKAGVEFFDSLLTQLRGIADEAHSG